MKIYHWYSILSTGMCMVKDLCFYAYETHVRIRAWSSTCVMPVFKYYWSKRPLINVYTMITPHTTFPFPRWSTSNLVTWMCFICSMLLMHVDTMQPAAWYVVQNIHSNKILFSWVPLTHENKSNRKFTTWILFTWKLVHSALL